MSTVHGLPAHILLNHFVIVLVPLTALLAVISALWPAARRRLVWLVLTLSVVSAALAPLTVSSGGWLADRMKSSPALDTHLELGATAGYCAAALVVVAVLLLTVHIRQHRGHRVGPGVQALVAVLVIATSVAVSVQTYRIGESGARAAWGDFAAAAR